MIFLNKNYFSINAITTGSLNNFVGLLFYLCMAPLISPQELLFCSHGFDHMHLTANSTEAHQ